MGEHGLCLLEKDEEGFLHGVGSIGGMKLQPLSRVAVEAGCVAIEEGVEGRGVASDEGGEQGLVAVGEARRTAAQGARGRPARRAQTPEEERAQRGEIGRVGRGREHGGLGEEVSEGHDWDAG
ncbi:hypothetical protein [Sorangium sp. So ce1335]|uniref:hypothetical protein n=1 Tax=Sorangium sp. So ce1335 TaxID=3133335 RepID=UPI003F5FD630